MKKSESKGKSDSNTKAPARKALSPKAKKSGETLKAKGAKEKSKTPAEPAATKTKPKAAVKAARKTKDSKPAAVAKPKVVKGEVPVKKKALKKNQKADVSTAEPLVPKFDREDIAHAAYFRYQKRVYFGHCPDPVADWYAAEAELMSGIKTD